ncbi:ComF family protein [Salegentibacter chungangensis]|uniref:ComF family protein n=1 Tax=Salegentibacter chungangensis TaxID=1335724 RepID=A0ABW3NNU8_9FLAO
MFHDLLNLLYPKTCNCCNGELTKNEEVICTSCLHELPLTNFHQDNVNPAKKVFYGRLQIENATALLYFRKKGMVQELIHNLKYRGNKEIGVYLGKWLGAELSQIEAYKDIQAVLPVPLHRKKLRSRGFNQVEGFARELAKSLDAEYMDDVLLKHSATSTQTLKNRISRWGVIEETFVIEQPEKLRHKHILLADDLITTGATLEACGTKLQEAGGVKISLAAMAITV